MNFARAIPDPVSLALQELKDTPEAVSLARICAVARKEVADWPCKASFDASWDNAYRASRNAAIDSFALCKDALDDLIFLVCQSHDLDRSDLPSTGEIVDRLAAQS